MPEFLGLRPVTASTTTTRSKGACGKHVELGSADQKRHLKRPVISNDAAII
jgi:hypothetical protein